MKKIDLHMRKIVSSSDAEFDAIDKGGLLHLVKTTWNQDDTEFEDYTECAIPNQPQHIIYLNIYKKLTELADGRDAFKDGAAREFLEAFDKHKTIQPIHQRSQQTVN